MDMEHSTTSKQPSKSFFLLDPNYQHGIEYDITGKVLPNSPSKSITESHGATDNKFNGDIIEIENNNNNNTNDTISNHQLNQCYKCRRILKSIGGLKLHKRSCKGAALAFISDLSTRTEENKNLTKITVSSIEDNALTSTQNDSLFQRDENDYIKTINSAFEKIVYWKKNHFDLPKGAVGKTFINEMTKLIDEWNTKSPNHDTSLTALMVMPALLLQRTSPKCKTSEVKKHLERRLEMWKNRNIDELLNASLTIQDRLPKNFSKPKDTEDLARRFAKLMLQGKVNPAIRLLDEGSNGGILPLTEDTMQCLQQKHPRGNAKNEMMLLQGPLKKINSIIYDNINANLIKRCAINTKGSAGPSGVDADFWRKIISSNIYGTTSDDLCHAIALMTRKLCSDELQDSNSIQALMACRLIPLDKSPGVRPIGIGEVLRRIIGKAVMTIVKPDILAATGYSQLCAGQEAGCEIAVHTVIDLYESDDTHGFIQIDARNAFNSINRKVLLHNIKVICPEISTYVTNCYQTPARLFVSGGKEIQSSEGTTQGDPVAMGMYAIGLMPLLTTVMESIKGANLIQIAFADDLTGVGAVKDLKLWWDMVLNYGPYLGYYVNETKSWLIVKEQRVSAGNNGRSTFNDRQNPLSDRLKLPSTDQNDR